MDFQKEIKRGRAALVGIAGREERVSDVERSLDELERLDEKSSEYDVDVLIITGNNIRASLARAEELIDKGYTVRLSEKMTDDIRYRELVSFEEEGV